MRRRLSLPAARVEPSLRRFQRPCVQCKLAAPFEGSRVRARAMDCRSLTPEEVPMPKPPVSRRTLLAPRLPRSPGQPHSRRGCWPRHPRQRRSPPRSWRRRRKASLHSIRRWTFRVAERLSRASGCLSRHRRAGGARGVRAPLPAHRPGARQQHLRGRRRQQRRRRALHRLEAQRLAGGLCARRRPGISHPRTAMPTACT